MPPLITSAPIALWRVICHTHGQRITEDIAHDQTVQAHIHGRHQCPVFHQVGVWHMEQPTVPEYAQDDAQTLDFFQKVGPFF